MTGYSCRWKESHQPQDEAKQSCSFNALLLFSRHGTQVVVEPSPEMMSEMLRQKSPVVIGVPSMISSPPSDVPKGPTSAPPQSQMAVILPEAASTYDLLGEGVDMERSILCCLRMKVGSRVTVGTQEFPTNHSFYAWYCTTTGWRTRHGYRRVGTW